jgi:hypothetical protein
MQIDYLSIIVVGIVTLFVGYFVGLFEGRGQEAPKEKKGEPPVTPATAPKENSLLNLSLDNNNLPRLELDGQRADSSQLAPEQRKRLIELMVMMRPWIDASAPKPSAPPQPVSPRPIPSTPVAASPVGIQIPKPTSKSIASMLVPNSKQEEAAPTSMVGQIDAILQTHLAETPLASRGVRLAESPDGGVIVWDGVKKYSGVSEVTDPQVQAMIRAAIAEWEKKYTPGV